MLERTINRLTCLVVLFLLLIFVPEVFASDNGQTSGAEPTYLSIGKISSAGQDGDRAWVRWRGRQIYMQPPFTLNTCGREISPTTDNLKSMAGRDCEARYVEVAGGIEFKRIECACAK